MYMYFRALRLSECECHLYTHQVLIYYYCKRDKKYQKPHFTWKEKIKVDLYHYTAILFDEQKDFSFQAQCMIFL